MDIAAVIQKVKDFCEKGEAIAALKEIQELRTKQIEYLKGESEEPVVLDKGEEIEIELLGTKASLINTLPKDTEMLNSVYKRIECIIKEAENLEDVGMIENKVFELIYEWEKPFISDSIEKLRNSFTDLSYNAYLKTSIDFTKVRLAVEMVFRQNEKVLLFAEKENLFKNGKKEGWDEYREKFIKKEKQFTDKMQKNAILEITTERFEALKEVIEKNSHMTMEGIRKLAEVVYPELYLVRRIYKGETLGKKSDEEMLESLHLYAGILRYLLEVVVYPNGKQMYFLLGTPREEHQELKEVYAKISKLDPNFVAPPLPPANATAEGVTNANSNSTAAAVITAIIMVGGAIAFIAWVISSM